MVHAETQTEQSAVCFSSVNNTSMYTISCTGQKRRPIQTLQDTLQKSWTYVTSCASSVRQKHMQAISQCRYAAQPAAFVISSVMMLPGMALLLQRR